MINKLPRWVFTPASRYDTESVTQIEAIGKLQGKMNELVEDYNKFVDDSNSAIESFMGTTREEQKIFASALRQEFQDFIDTVNLEFKEMEKIISDQFTDTDSLINNGLREIDRAKNVMLAEIEVAGEIFQTLGNSETGVVSQAAITREIQRIDNELFVFKNFDFSQYVKTGYYLQASDGSEIVHGGMEYALIPCSSGERYRVTYLNTPPFSYTPCWIANESLVRTQKILSEISEIVPGESVEFNVNEGDAYIAINYDFGSTGRPTLEKFTPSLSEDVKKLLEAHDCPSPIFENEIVTTASNLQDVCTEKSFVFAIVSDSHYSGVNNWKNTFKNIKAVNSRYKFDAIFHLGDIIDGIYSKEESVALLEDVRNDLISIGVPVFTLVGNHDDNTQYEDTSRQITSGEQYAILGRYNDSLVKRPSNKMYFYYDLESFDIRVVCLHSHLGDEGTSEASSWGFTQEQIDWVENTALNTDKTVIFFSHIPFTQSLTCYNYQATNGIALRSIIETFISNGGKVVGLFHGHNHWDHIGSGTGAFKEISTGCSLCRVSTPDYITEGAVIPNRTEGTISEDLWDAVAVQTSSRTVKMIRFGAGNDRTFNY